MLDGDLGDYARLYSNISNDNTYREFGWLDKRLFRIYEHLPIRNTGKSFWYGAWKKHVNEYDTFIIFDGARGGDVAKFIQNNNPKSKIIVYYYNSLDKGDKKAPDNYKDVDVEFYSFDKEDAAEWNINYKNYFFNGVLAAEKYLHSANNTKYDVFFVGKDKGRLRNIISFTKKLRDNKLTVDLNIIPSKDKYSDEEKEYLSDTYLTYSQVLARSNNAKAILELKEAGQKGMTLRPLEALFLHKKLITADENIVYQDFYCKDNIFVLKDDFLVEDLAEFLSIPYKTVAEEIVNRYRLEYWLDDFYATKKS